MQLRRIRTKGEDVVQLHSGRHWVELAKILPYVSSRAVDDEAASWSTCVIDLLTAPADVQAEIVAIAKDLPCDDTVGRSVLLPFQPRSFRDFMLFEGHAIDAARGFVRAFRPHLYPFITAYERFTGSEFPKLKPKKLWYRQPIYYMGNALTVVGDGATITRPSYTKALDYELELGFVLSREICNASSKEAEAAIGGFLVVNDFSARDVQLDEMASGFGPQKSKHFATAISTTLVTADEVLPRWPDIRGWVKVNGELIARPASERPHWSLGEALAHASRDERLYPGELFATGTLPGGSGIENGQLLVPGDVVEIGIEGIGKLTNVVREE